MDNEVVARVLRQIRESRGVAQARVLTGSCSHDEYRYLCGEIHGLDLAEDHLMAVLKKAEDSDDE